MNNPEAIVIELLTAFHGGHPMSIIDTLDHDDKGDVISSLTGMLYGACCSAAAAEGTTVDHLLQTMGRVNANLQDEAPNA